MAAIQEINESLLDQHLTALEAARQWSPRVISKLEALIRTGSNGDPFRINSIKYASDRGMPEAEAIDLFLYAFKILLRQVTSSSAKMSTTHPMSVRHCPASM